MNELDANIVVDGQKSVAVVNMSGDIVKDGGEVDATCVIETAQGRQKVVKTYLMGGGGGGGGTWGSITGILSDQTDLQNALNAKQDTLTAGTGIDITGNVISATGGGGGSAPTLTWYTNKTGSSITIADTSAANLVKVYKNGLLLEPTADYSISGTTLTLVTALVVTDKITTEVF